MRNGGRTRQARHAAVIGSGITGLAAARVLSDRGARVTHPRARRRSPTPRRPSQAFARWKRRARRRCATRTPSSAGCAACCATRTPTCSTRCAPPAPPSSTCSSARRSPCRRYSREPGDEDLVALGCRRTTFEWVMRAQRAGAPRRRAGARRPGARPARRPTRRRRRSPACATAPATGVELAADLVIDASGRHSRAPEWLAAIGAPPPREKLEHSGIVYYTRFYRLRDGAAAAAAEPRTPARPTTTGSSTRSSPPTIAPSRSPSPSPLAFPRLKVLARPARVRRDDARPAGAGAVGGAGGRRSRSAIPTIRCRRWAA